ncbi:hypothetical protein KP509_03G096700 [Ceratopteris richardii]|uniref:J domain-containing protein n=1 Tax=Ceratopteris richardii TaxID=49495 RepID=A0A8T2VDU9_CERRI|nr:hypothetical protein KP509_03G096700 [Ceratopteris richardii]
MSSDVIFRTSFLRNPLHSHSFGQSSSKPRVYPRSKSRVVCAVAGVRPKSRTLYDLLELSPGVSTADIKQAYRQLARKYHPDVCPSNQTEESTRRFIEIQEAYETLSDPRLRAVYDHAIAMGRESAATGRMPWMSTAMESEPSQWKSQWKSQLSGLRRRSDMKAWKADSWSARVRREAEGSVE